MVNVSKFYVKVRPDSDEFEVECSGSFPVVRLESSAENGRANSELVGRLCEILDVDVGIMKGHRSRRKLVVADIEKDEALSLLCDYDDQA